jgi:2-polyprenyl-3-methyl-5-hydroxy-6-metoxy-1,4-benzoquinol methylase
MPKTDTMPQVRQFWNQIATDFDAIYTGQGKSGLSRAMDKILRKDIYERFDWVMRKSGDVRGKSICDIGCGSGRFIAEFAKNGARRVVGVDVAPNMLTLAQQLVQERGVAGPCEFVHSDVIDWKTNEKFDETIAIGFWDYIAEPAERLRIIRKMTNEKFLSAWPRYWTWRMPVRKIRLGLAGCPVYFFKRGEVIEMIEDAGFRVESCEVVGKLFCVDARPR